MDKCIEISILEMRKREDFEILRAYRPLLPLFVISRRRTLIQTVGNDHDVMYDGEPVTTRYMPS